jgi:hypothetical protein
MLWASLVLGLPSLVLAAGANREVRRRGMLLLFVGPIVAVVFVGMALLEPGWGRTPAMALFGVEVGASWAFVGALMLHPHGPHGGVDRGALAVEGLSAGFAVLGLAWLLDDLDRGHATAPKAALVLLWVATAAWVVAARYVPALHARTPPLSAAYPVLTAASAVGLLVAGARFIVGGFNTVGLLIGLISVAMVAMVAPELGKAGRSALAATAWGCLVAAVTVMVLASLV